MAFFYTVIINKDVTYTVWSTGEIFGPTTTASPYNVPVGTVTPYQIHAIGGGQAGFLASGDGSSQGARGGNGGSYAFLNATLIGDLVFSIGTGGAVGTNGTPGGDTWVKNSGGTTLLLAAGGASASANIGTASFAGGSGNVARGSPIGLGGGGGGGGAGPAGVGGNAGSVTSTQIKLSAPAVTNSNGGTGGGAANGGRPGFTPAYAGTNHNAPSIYGGSLEFIGGDGGDTFNPTQWINAAVLTGNSGTLFGRGGNMWGCGGSGGASPELVSSAYVNRIGMPAIAPYAAGTQGAAGSIASSGGAGAIWGAVPDWATQEPPAYASGTLAGPGGGGGGGAGGNYNDTVGTYTHKGGTGAPYGGGGGGQGNYAPGNTIAAPPYDGSGQGGDGVLVLIFGVEAPIPPPTPTGRNWVARVGPIYTAG